MGASSSTEQATTTEQREAESIAASSGGLSLLQNVFSNLSLPQTHTISPSSLQVRLLSTIVLHSHLLPFIY